MMLAEALALRAESARRIEQLHGWNRQPRSELPFILREGVSCCESGYAGAANYSGSRSLRIR
jgi:hypothetical protein